MLNISKKQIFSPLIVLLLVFAFIFQQSLEDQFKLPPLKVSKQESAINIKADLLPLFHLGQERLISSFLWITTLIESDTEHYKNNDLNSWLYLRFLSTISLDPYFYEAYLYGGLYLSVIKDDIQGSQDIFTRALEYFPEDFWINFYTGHNYYFELNDSQSAYFHFLKIKDHPVTKKQAPYLPSLIAKIKAEQGDLDTAYKLLRTAVEKIPTDSFFYKKFSKSLYAIKAEIDLDCLNQKQRNNCSSFDYNGAPYTLGVDGKYRAQEKWLPFRPRKIQK